ncbi:MAG: rRNA processing protein RimM [Enterovirga sp.]|nr:rRNA processing protein RimM [Enterovirga sp.]
MAEDGRDPTRAPAPVPGGRSGGPAGHVLLAEFGRAQGLRGEVRLKSHTAEPRAVAAYGPLVTEDGRTIVLRDLRQAAGGQTDMLVVRVDGVTTREGAEALNRVRLYVPRERLGEPEADEFFLADLVGLSARTEAGEPLGTIVAVPNYGGGDILEIAPPQGATLLVPFTKACVPAVDLRAGFVTVNEAALTAPDPAGGPGEDADSEAEPELPSAG